MLVWETMAFWLVDGSTVDRVRKENQVVVVLLAYAEFFRILGVNGWALEECDQRATLASSPINNR